MAVLVQILLVALFTILGGTLVLVLGRVLDQLYIQPAQALKRLNGKIAFHLLYYNQLLHNPDAAPADTKEEAARACRVLAAELAEHMQLIPRRRMARSLLGIPGRKNLSRAVANLSGLAHALEHGKAETVQELRSNVERFLKIRL